MRTVPTKSLALFASCVALLLPNPSGAQNDVDLDQLTQEHVAYALNAELDDVYERLNANQLHDLNNIFHPLLLHVQMYKRAKDPAARFVRSMEMMERVLKHGIETVERLRDFSRQAPR